MVPDVDEALAFYTKVLGLEQRADRPDIGIDGAWLDAGPQQLHLIQGEAPPGMGQHFALLIDDLDTTVAELRQQGLDVSDPRPIGTSRQSFLADPSGNMIELHQANAV
jgi:catechol 2,3-dioxygenase-like lactoylglutathione lyase family enzyme